MYKFREQLQEWETRDKIQRQEEREKKFNTKRKLSIFSGRGKTHEQRKVSPCRTISAQSGANMQGERNVVFEFAVVFPTSQIKAFNENFTSFVVQDVDGISLIATEPCSLEPENDFRTMSTKALSSRGSMTKRLTKKVLETADRQHSFILLTAPDEFYRRKAHTMKMSVYTLDSDLRSDLKVYNKEKAIQFRPFSSADRQEILHTELDERVNLNGLQKRGTITTIIPLHSPEDQQYILKKWLYEDGRYQFPPFGRMNEYIFDSERNKFEALNTIQSYSGAKAAMYYGFFQMYQAWLLLVPVPFGIALFAVQYASNTLYDHPLVPLYCFVITLWSTFFVERLKRKEAEILHTWDLLEDLDTIKRSRKEFYGDDTIDFRTMKREVYFPQAVRNRIKGSYVTVILIRNSCSHILCLFPVASMPMFLLILVAVVGFYYLFEVRIGYYS